MDMCEVVEAKLRRQRHLSGEEEYDTLGPNPHTTYRGQMDKDEAILADAMLCVLDDTPLTAEWIKQVLPAVGSPAPAARESAEYRGRVASISWVSWDSGLCLYVQQDGIAWQAMTRGQLRALAHAAGIELKEVGR